MLSFSDGIRYDCKSCFQYIIYCSSSSWILVKSIVELNNGEIYLDSDGENGTEFEILLPNEKLDGDEYEYNYEVDIEKIELEFSDIYELYS